jgi:predicted RNA-binding protein YlqC (UPF0109 family)
MKTFVLGIVRALADHPDNMKVSAIMGARTAVFEVRCDSRDLGRLIGRNGRTVQAMQILVNNLAARQHKRAILEITD